MEYTAFISHSNRDEKVIKAIRNYLESLGYVCFVSDRDLKHNANWQKQLVEAMDSSRMLIYIHSKNSNVSEEVSREINYFADRCHRPILVYRISNEEYNNDRAYYVQSINYIDALDNPCSGLDDLGKNVKETLDGLKKTGYSGGSGRAGAGWRRLAFIACGLLVLCAIGFAYHGFERKTLKSSFDLCNLYLSRIDGYLSSEDSLDRVFISIGQAEEAVQKCHKLLTVKQPDYPDFQAERERCSTSLAGIRNRRIASVKALYEPMRYASRSTWSTSVDAIMTNIAKIRQIDSLLGFTPDETIADIENKIK